MPNPTGNDSLITHTQNHSIDFKIELSLTECMVPWIAPCLGYNRKLVGHWIRFALDEYGSNPRAVLLYREMVPPLPTVKHVIPAEPVSSANLALPYDARWIMGPAANTANSARIGHDISRTFQQPSCGVGSEGAILVVRRRLYLNSNGRFGFFSSLSALFQQTKLRVPLLGA